jgi:hypothetical protein
MFCQKKHQKNKNKSFDFLLEQKRSLAQVNELARGLKFFQHTQLTIR